MKDIIAWLRKLEMLASNVYQQAAEKLASDQQFSAFLERMSEEEAWHYHLMGSAAASIQDAGDVSASALLIDDATKRKITDPFLALSAMVEKGEATRKDVLHCILETEFSEWNAIFIYAIRAMLPMDPMFQHIAATMESHKEKLTAFIDELPPDALPSESLPNLPKVWDRRILVVSDDAALRDLLVEILGEVAVVEIATNGKEGRDRLDAGFYNVIISGVKMAEIDGITLYRQAVSAMPRLKHHFLFLTANASPETHQFFSENHVPVIYKPFTIDKLMRAVSDIMDKSL